MESAAPFTRDFHPLDNARAEHTKRKSPVNLAIYRTLCGERGIRTPGASQHGGFQDRCNRPLYHLSFVRDKLRVSKRVQRYGFIFNLARFLPFFFKKNAFYSVLFIKKSEKCLFLGGKTKKTKQKRAFYLVIQITCTTFAV